jgi:hypothetical protein
MSREGARVDIFAAMGKSDHGRILWSKRIDVGGMIPFGEEEAAVVTAAAMNSVIRSFSRRNGTTAHTKWETAAFHIHFLSHTTPTAYTQPARRK